MNKLFIPIVGLLFAIAFPLSAQMTDEQVVDYVKSAAESGKSESTISKELLAKGVTMEQAERIKAKYEDQLNGNASSVTGMAVTGNLSKRDSRANSYADNPEESSDSTYDGMVGSLTDDDPKNIPIFGHDVFGGNSTVSFEPNENVATPDSYVLGPGDEIVIEIWGISEARIASVISPEGRINISQVGPVQLSGLTIKEAAKKIKGKLAGKYAGVGGPDGNISVTLGNIRTIQVNVLGLVKNPGTFRLSPFTTVFNALYRAGGISEAGSLRSVRVVRDGEQIADVDIYDFLFTGNKSNDISLQEGDVVIVPPYKEIVTVKGGVKREMRYELKEGQSLSDLIEYAGGFSSGAYRNDVKIIRNTEKEKEILTVKSDNYDSCILNDGDEVSVGMNLDRFANRVEIRGYVFRPGEFQIGGDIATVRQLVNMAGGPQEDAFLGRAVLLREKEDLSLETIQVNIGAILDGSMEDMLLKKNDVLVISGIHELEDRGEYTINGMVMNPGTFAFAENTTVEDLILRAGGLVDGASTARVDVARRLYDPNSLTWSDTLALTFSFAIKDGLAMDGGEDFILEPYDVVSVRRSPGFRPQKFVEIQGNVAFPGRYVLLNDSERLTDIVERAGGFVGNANPRGAMLIRQRNNAMEKRLLSESMEKLSTMSSVDTLNVEVDAEYKIAVDLDYAMAHQGSNADIILQEGDYINIPELVNTVQISGEVMAPNAVVFRPGKTVAYYINAAGGFTDRSRRSRVYVIYQNGKAARNVLNNAKVEPGCTIVVPSKLERKPLSTSDVLATASVASSLTSIVAMLIRLF